MGYSIRTKDFRYTQWRKWLKMSQIADWSNAGLVATELYDHRKNHFGADAALFENDNLAGKSEHRRIEGALKYNLEIVVKSSEYSNSRCARSHLILQESSSLQFNLCSVAITPDECESLYLHKCAWFESYGCQPSTFCAFTKEMSETVPQDCSSFPTRCKWQQETQIFPERCIARQSTFWNV